MGNEAVKHFKKSFKNQGFTDNVLELWTPRKRKSRRRGIRNILVKSGDLRRSIKVNRRTFNSVTIGSKTAGDYGEVHNEGLRAGRGRGFRMPKRQFIGDSRQLTNRLRTRLNTDIKQAFNV